MAKTMRRGTGAAGLNITSMMDVMTIILVFLLKSYSTEDISVAPSGELQLPLSSSHVIPKLAVNVVVSSTTIVVDGAEVVALETTTDASGARVVQIPEAEKKGFLISRLHDVLTAKAEVAKSLGARAEKAELGFQGQILLQCHKELPFSVIRDVMFTAGQAQFGEFRFVVIKAAG